MKNEKMMKKDNFSSIEQKKDNEISDQKELTFKEPDELIDFVIEKEKIKQVFINEIKEIINIMKKLIYAPPYKILFGRIYIEKLKETKKNETNDQHENINDDFYDGFEIT